MFTLTDAWWCGRLGKESLAAFGTASFFIWGVTAISLASSVGLASRVARSTGAGDRAVAGEAARDGVAAAFFVSLTTALLLWLAAPALVAFQGAAPEVVAEATAYLRMIALGAPAWFLHDAADGALRGSGDTRTSAVAGSVAVGANFLLDPLFIFGWGPIPSLGVAGVGIATAVTQTGTAFFLWRVVLKRKGLSLSLPTFRGILSTLRIGSPSAALGAGFASIYVLITPLVAAFGTAELAAMTIGHRSESFVYMVSVGYAAAAQALVGHSLGAGDVEGARAIARRCAFHACSFAVAFSVLLAVGGSAFARFFTDDPQTIQAGAIYLAIVALSLGPQTLEQVLTGAFEGAGDTIPPLLVGILAHGARLPLILLATSVFGFGVTSIWWTIAGCSVVAGAVMARLFQRRTWAPGGTR